MVGCILKKSILRNIHVEGALFQKQKYLVGRLIWYSRKGQTMSRILLVEDDLSLVTGLSFALEKQGFDLTVARTVAETEAAWERGRYDLMILDVSLPDGSGFDICRKVRQTSRMPVMFLTASDEEVNIIMGLDLGGDDYITKPFKLGVLVSRINALLRRAGQQGAGVAEVKSQGIRLAPLEGEAYKDGKRLELTAAEYRLLSYFMQNPNQVLSPGQILGWLWDGGERYVDGNTLSVYIHRLRAKIEDDPGRPRLLLTVRRMGYKWNGEERL